MSKTLPRGQNKNQTSVASGEISWSLCAAETHSKLVSGLKTTDGRQVNVLLLRSRRLDRQQRVNGKMMKRSEMCRRMHATMQSISTRAANDCARTLSMAKFLQTHQGAKMRFRVLAGSGSCSSWMSNFPSAAGLNCLRHHAERIRIRSMSTAAGLCCRKSQ